MEAQREPPAEIHHVQKLFGIAAMGAVIGIIQVLR
jgi:hypothetical protein